MIEWPIILHLNASTSLNMLLLVRVILEPDELHDCSFYAASLEAQGVLVHHGLGRQTTRAMVATIM